MKDDRHYYVTTPIYYVNDYPHIGHAYTTVACDAAARFWRLQGKEVAFLTGTDEHGQKIEKTAAANGEEPIELADRVVKRFQSLWEELNISHTDFIRTTEARHRKGVEAFYRKVFAKGDIYAGEYEGWYAINDEAFLTETQLKELGDKIENDPNIVKLKEKTYFFKLSAYQQKLLDHIEKNPQFIQPVSKRNEVVSFIEQGLKDLSISRTSFKWGIPVPDDEEHVIYVWFDALTNYMTAVGYGSDDKNFEKWWPANVHVVGKDILRFHAIFWPAFLMSADLPLPDCVYAHGWWTIEGEKMSKSKGNFVDPFEMVEMYGADAFRYFLLREFPFGQDGDFSKEAFIDRVNSELANDLGNLASRILAMTSKYFDGKIPDPGTTTEADDKLKTETEDGAKKYIEYMTDMRFCDALKAAWQGISAANKYVNDEEPWHLAKDETKKERLATVMYHVLETLRMTSLLIFPFMPAMANSLREKLSLPAVNETSTSTLTEQLTWGQLKTQTAVDRGKPLFQRIDKNA